jgi:hypothetical protein
VLTKQDDQQGLEDQGGDDSDGEVRITVNNRFNWEFLSFEGLVD